jgi:hypothetical protein
VEEEMRRLALVVAPMLVATLIVPAPAQAKVLNDLLANAIDITELPFRAALNVTGTTVSDEDPDCHGSEHSVWYKITPGTDMKLYAQMRRSHFRPYVSVWTQGASGFEEVQCNRYSSALWEGTAGTTYFIRVAANARIRSGRGVFKVREVPPPTEVTISIDPQGSIDPQTEQVTISGSLLCSQPDEIYYYGVLRQEGPDRRFIEGYFEGEVEECSSDAASPFSATFFGDGVFEDGSATVEFTAYAYNRWDYTFDREVFVVDLTKN